jgi:ribosome biogenesis GTPase
MEIKDYPLALVIAEHKEAYVVKTADNEYLAKITGKLRHLAASREDYPAVGDWVSITPLDKENATIEKILPRRTILKKKYSNKQEAQIIAANIDVAFIAESLDRDFNLNRLERYLVLVSDGKIKPVILLTKTDLANLDEINLKIQAIKNRFGKIDILQTTAQAESGIGELGKYIEKDKIYCFIGSSGVGKSTLINRLLNKNTIKTGELSPTTKKGKHTTTARSMYFLENGGIVIDNPGTREVGMADVSQGLENIFDKIAELSRECKFSDCTHSHEPGCAVCKALQDGSLGEEQFQNYLKLKKENDFYQLTKQERREKDRKFGQLIKKTLEQIKDL